MHILELHLKNFGKFTDCHIDLSNHIQVIYGENEYGKSTIYAFIKAMLFGMERGRGRAAGKDEFSRHEPWENPNYYAGMMRFRCGGRTFRLERTFDRYTKNVSLVCEDDGEELSVEAGDLEMLLGGISAAGFENTAAIGQLTAKPGKELAGELQNYAANYFETGSSEVNLQGALDSLRLRKKQAEQEQKTHREERLKKAEKLELQRRYVETDEKRLRAKLAETKIRLDEMRERVKLTAGEQKNEGIGQHEIEEQQWKTGKLYVMNGILLSAVWAGLLAYGVPGWLVTLGVLMIGGGIALAAAGVFRIWRYDKKSRNSVGIAGEEKTPDLQNIQKSEWEIVRIQEELKEKQLQKDNLSEQILDLEERGEAEHRLRKKVQALELAELRMKEAAGKVVQNFGERLNRDTSRILSRITDGKYTKLIADEKLDMAVFCDGKRIPVERLSRGTIEQIYFSLRMAALNILYEEELPVILDDAFVFYDEKRLKSALKWLSEQPRQVIIFSCQTREEKILASLE